MTRPVAGPAGPAARHAGVGGTGLLAAICGGEPRPLHDPAGRVSDRSSSPQSDGGPGFVECWAAGLGDPPAVCRPLNVERAAWVFDPGSAAAYLECAQEKIRVAGGPAHARTALAAAWQGVGQLIAAALQARAKLGSWWGGGGMYRREDDYGLAAWTRPADSWPTSEVIAASDVNTHGGTAGCSRHQEGRTCVGRPSGNRRCGRGRRRRVSYEPGASAAIFRLLAVGGRYQSGAAIITRARICRDLADAG